MCVNWINLAQEGPSRSLAHDWRSYLPATFEMERHILRKIIEICQ
jgi:hypothetical protein